MSRITIEQLIKATRKQQNISRARLSAGVCSEQTLADLEAGRYKASLPQQSILLSRMGVSVDKMELFISAEDYNMVRLRDLLEEAICKGKRQLAVHVIEQYPVQNAVDRMYRHRMIAALTYHIDHDLPETERWLREAVSDTLPDFFYEQLPSLLLSVWEVENLLAFERVRLEQGAADVAYLRSCLSYIDSHFKDEEDHAQIYAKCAWLLARAYKEQGDYGQAITLCTMSLEYLSANNMLYFMRPILEVLLCAQEHLGIDRSENLYAVYYDILGSLWRDYGKAWYPTDWIFHGCCYKEYHLDYELIRCEREARGITQEQLIEGIYRNTESLSRLEHGKLTPNRRTFEKLLERFGIERDRYCGYVMTDSPAVMELKKDVDRLLSRYCYEEALGRLTELRASLDMSLWCNRLPIETMEISIALHNGQITAEQALERQLELMGHFFNFEKKCFYHIPMRNEATLTMGVAETLCHLNRKQEGIELYQMMLDKMRSSRIDVKYRHRTYVSILYNYALLGESKKAAHEGISQAVLCGKATRLVHMVSLLLNIEESETSRTECKQRTLEVYYLTDLFGIELYKKIYAEYLYKEFGIEIKTQSL